MNLSDKIESMILLRNNTPLDDFMGLTPNEMTALCYEPFTDASPVRLRTTFSNEVLDRISLFRVAEEYLRILESLGELKFTATGALPPKIVKELYAKNYLVDEAIESGITKLAREENCIYILTMRFVVELAGLVKKKNNLYSLTKLGIKLLQPHKRSELFTAFFKAFTEKFLWSYLDRYNEHTAGQFAWAYSIYLLHKFGDKPQKADYYSNLYIRAFPTFLKQFISGYSTPEDIFESCYEVRVFKRFCQWFGLVTMEVHKDEVPYYKTTCKTDLVELLFEFDEE